MNRGDHDDRHIGILFLSSFEQTDTVEVCHHQVGEHELKLISGGEDGEGLNAGTCMFAEISGGSKHRRHNFPDWFFVVNYKNAIRHGDTRSLSAIVILPRDSESNHAGPKLHRKSTEA